MKTLLTIAMISCSTILLAQDQRGFQGNLYSANTIINFSGRTITIGHDVYNIVSRDFDGDKTNSFRCTIRRSTFTIIYITNHSLTVTDNHGLRTVYPLQ